MGPLSAPRFFGWDDSEREAAVNAARTQRLQAALQDPLADPIAYLDSAPYDPWAMSEADQWNMPSTQERVRDAFGRIGLGPGALGTISRGGLGAYLLSLSHYANKAKGGPANALNPAFRLGELTKEQTAELAKLTGKRFGAPAELYAHPALLRHDYGSRYLKNSLNLKEIADLLTRGAATDARVLRGDRGALMLESKMAKPSHYGSQLLLNSDAPGNRVWVNALSVPPRTITRAGMGQTLPPQGTMTPQQIQELLNAYDELTGYLSRSVYRPGELSLGRRVFKR